MKALSNAELMHTHYFAERIHSIVCFKCEIIEITRTWEQCLFNGWAEWCSADAIIVMRVCLKRQCTHLHDMRYYTWVILKLNKSWSCSQIVNHVVLKPASLDTFAISETLWRGHTSPNVQGASQHRF